MKKMMACKVVFRSTYGAQAWRVMLEIQLAGYFGYKPSENWNLFAGYRYIDFDYESDNEQKFFYDIDISGPLIGFGYYFLNDARYM